MFQEKRKKNRVGTHIVTEISVAGEYQRYCGYIENINENGMGIVSLDLFKPGEKVDTGFYLSGLSGKLCPKASLVHTRKGDYNLYYHGFQFDSLSDKDRQYIEKFMNENNLTQSV